jgi:hypothetical protein
LDGECCQSVQRRIGLCRIPVTGGYSAGCKSLKGPPGRHRTGQQATVSASGCLAAAARLSLKNRLRGLATKTQRLRHLGALCRVVRCNHRVVLREAPLRAVLGRGETVLRQVAFQRLVAPAVLEADQIIRRDRLLNRDRRDRLGRFGRGGGRTKARDRRVNGRDESRQIGRANGIVADVSSDNLRGEFSAVLG